MTNRIVIIIVMLLLALGWLCLHAQTNLPGDKLSPPPSLKLSGNMLARAAAFVQVPITNLLVTASVLAPYQIQGSTDLSNWTAITNIYFSATVPVNNNGSNLYVRGMWLSNACVVIDTNQQ